MFTSVSLNFKRDLKRINFLLPTSEKNKTIASLSDISINGLIKSLTTMMNTYSMFWTDIYHESIVEHDPRLQSICTQLPWIYFDHIIDVDWMAARTNDDKVLSHPIVIYLNKMAPKSEKFERKNTDVIYQRPKPAHVPFVTVADVFNSKGYQGKPYTSGLYACSKVKINPRNRWFKLYERNPRFTFTISALSTQLNRAIQARSRFTDDEPDETIPRSFVIPMEQYPKCYKVRIYHRQTSNEMKEGASFPLTWEEPDPSASVDDVSRVALSHITLLCRDVICECNKCTTGCPVNKSECDACKLGKYNCRYSDSSPIQCYGSFAEGCLLPTFFDWNEMNEATKKWGDIDYMFDTGHQVGFSVGNASNILATIEMEDCKPGYLRLREAENSEILRFSGELNFDASFAKTIKNLKQNSSKIIPQVLELLEMLSEESERDKRHSNRLRQSVYEKSFTRGPAMTNISCKGGMDKDEVKYFSCSSWPPIAQTWTDRERQSKWPPKEIIQEIILKGCRIVHKAHPSSKDPDAEFRFSFSVAELILFKTLSVDQKKCFIAFKALVKYKISRSKILTKNEIDLSTYHLKTIFLWTCETIPADQWHTTNGWARCLLYMIDQLYACLKSRTLPGYFIEESNLMDSIELPQTLVREISKLRRNPITSAATFLDSTRCFRHSHFKISDHVRDFSDEEITLEKQLIFLQTMTIDMDSSRGVALWKKETVLRIFAIWCHQNSHKIHLAPWQCLTREMTLFDVVHLDILHEFDVPNNVLRGYVDRECSVDVVCRLPIPYSMKALKRKDYKNKVEYSLHFKTLLMIHHSINYKHPTSESIIISVSILMRCKEYEMTAIVLESAIYELLFCMKIIRCKELYYTDLVSPKTRNEVQEMSNILLFEDLMGISHLGMFQGILHLICLFLSVCYKYCGNEGKREELLYRMNFAIEVPFHLKDNRFSFLTYAFALLLLELFENSEKWRSFHVNIYRMLMSDKIRAIERESAERKKNFDLVTIEENKPAIRMVGRFPFQLPLSFCSCHVLMNSFLMQINDSFIDITDVPIEIFERILHTITYSMLTNADRIYVCQVLIFGREVERAISILKDIVKEEGDLSISMVIWPKELYGSRFIDENLRNELIKSSDDYIVFPTNLYARYLLTIAYTLSGEDEKGSNNLAELILHLDRYSQVPEFAPMLKILSTVIDC